MAYIQRNMPKPPPTLAWAVNNFQGGLNNVLSELLIQDNQATNICNVDFTDDAVLENRGGLKLIENIGEVGEITFFDSFNSTYDVPRNVAICNGNVYVNKVKVLDAKGITSGIQFNDKYYMINGTELYALGKFPQELSTHIKPWGTPVATEIVMKAVAPPSDFTPLDTTYTTGVYNYNYDTMTCWYEPCTNEINDVYKGVNVFPTSPTLIGVHQERLVIISDLEDPGTVYISDMNSAFYYPAGLGMHIPPKGDRIVGMEIFTDSIVIGTNKELYAIYGNTNRDAVGSVFSMKKINTHTGFINNTSIEPMNNNLVYVGSDNNVYSMYTTKTDVSILMTTILSRTVDLTKSPISATTNNLAKSKSIFYKDNMYILIPDLKIIMVFSYRYIAWTLYRTQVPITSIGIYSDKLAFGDSDGNVFEMDKETYSDNGIPFACYWHSKRFSFGDSTIYKKFKDMYMVAHVYNDVRSDVFLTYEVDYVDIKKKETISTQISKWGVSDFGDRFINRNIAPSLPVTIGQRGRYIKFIVYHGFFITETFATQDDFEIAQKENQCFYYITETNKYYFYDTGNVIELIDTDIFQPMKVYSISGTYQLKGRR